MNEFDFIRKIREQARSRRASPDLLRGIGDDAAVFRSAPGTNLVISTDLLIEGIDFRHESTSPNMLGHKALAVCLSDIAAMGARPRWAMLSLGFPQAVWDSNFGDRFYEGFFKLADMYGVRLIGGDVSRTPDKTVIDSIVIGECNSNRAVLRSGAQPGDQVYVTGFLGDAAAGLRLLERGARLHEAVDQDDQASAYDEPVASHPFDRLLLRQLKPQPRVGWGMLLGDQQLASAMIDLSDGLSSDLNHLCAESQVGALIDASRIPIDPLVQDVCGRRALDPLMLALHGGEDFELLFTVSPANISKLPTRVDGVSISQIGEITCDVGKVCVSEKDRVWDLPAGGFDHFNS